MTPIENISDLSEGSLVYIYLDDEPINGYIIEVSEIADGISTLVVSHEDDFEEQVIDVVWDADNGSILDPEIYLH